LNKTPNCFLWLQRATWSL